MSPSADASGLASGSRLRVRSGSPTAEEAVAALLAIDQAIAEERRAGPQGPPTSGWRRAARLEAVGLAGLGSVADLQARLRT